MVRLFPSCIASALVLSSFHVLATEDLDEVSVSLLERTIVMLDLAITMKTDDPDDTGYDEFYYYENQKDRAIVAKRDNKCYAVFRDSTFGQGDWAQNLVPGVARACNDNGCCFVRRGFWQAWNNDFRVELEDDLRGCVSRTCPDSLDCVVLGGGSQGGAISVVASIALADLNPEVLTTGLPTTVTIGCSNEVFDPSKLVRFINTRVDTSVNGNDRVSYDTVPMLPAAGFTRHYGHPILLDENGGIAGLGYNTRARFRPWDFTFDTHWLETYSLNLERIVEDHVGMDTVSLVGFPAGSVCTKGVECESGICEGDDEIPPFYCT